LISYSKRENLTSQSARQIFALDRIPKRLNGIAKNGSARFCEMNRSDGCDNLYRIGRHGG
jgi:hypothetical protein